MRLKRKVLILGGGGFIGSGIARILSKREKYDLTIADNFHHDQDDEIFMNFISDNNIKLIKADFTEKSSYDLLDKHYKYFLKRNKKWLYYLEENYEYLCNYITEEHHTSIRWLKWQGFNFSKPMLVKNVKVLYFYKRLHDVVKIGMQPVLNDLGPTWKTELSQKR